MFSFFFVHAGTALLLMQRKVQRFSLQVIMHLLAISCSILIFFATLWINEHRFAVIRSWSQLLKLQSHCCSWTLLPECFSGTLDGHRWWGLKAMTESSELPELIFLSKGSYLIACHKHKSEVQSKWSMSGRKTAGRLAEVTELVNIPTHIRFWGLDSGIRHRWIHSWLTFVFSTLNVP